MYVVFCPAGQKTTYTESSVHLRLILDLQRRAPRTRRKLKRELVGDLVWVGLEVCARQFREQQLRRAVGLLQMRVAGEDERLDAKLGIFLHALRDRIRVAHQRRSGAAAHQPDSGPEIWADLQAVTTALVERGHAPLAVSLRVGELLMRLGDR